MTKPKKVKLQQHAHAKLKSERKELKEEIKELESEKELLESKLEELKDQVEEQQNEYGRKCAEFAELFKMVRPDRPTLSFPFGQSVHVAVLDVPAKPLMPLLNYLNETLWKFKLKHVNVGCIAMNVEMAVAVFGEKYPSMTYATYPVVVTQAIAKKQVLIFSTFYAG